MKGKPNQLEDLGPEFQLDLFHEIIVDPKFGESVIETLNEGHFKTIAFQKILFQLKNYYTKHDGVIMTFPILRSQINMEVPDMTFRTQILDTVDQIEKRVVTNKNIQEYVVKFCKMQSLKNVLQDISKKVEMGIVEEYDQIEKKLKDALIFKETNDSITLFHDMENVLSDDFRDPIASGISGIDEIMGGGISKGELALVIAPLGVGKTTYLTKVASTAYLNGKNVLQVFFEDKEKAIQIKHYSIITGVNLTDIVNVGRNLALARLDQFKKTREGKPGNLFLQKLPSDGVTITKIKNIIKKLNSQGHKIDLLVLDYIDCISLEKEYANINSDEWASEGRVMRLLETMIEEVGVACWTATQGNRASTSIEVVKTENMGGSLKKAQIAHFIMSIGKTLEQKEAGVATISVLKNRLGKDGMIFPNCKFDNGNLIIDTDEQLTEKGFEIQKTAKQKSKQRNMYQEHINGNGQNSNTPTETN